MENPHINTSADLTKPPESEVEIIVGFNPQHSATNKIHLIL